MECIMHKSEGLGVVCKQFPALLLWVFFSNLTVLAGWVCLLPECIVMIESELAAVAKKLETCI